MTKSPALAQHSANREQRAHHLGGHHVLPAAVHIAPILVPLAAIGLVLVMVGAAVVHTRRNEPMNVAVNVVLIALAVFVAWGRFGPYSFTP